MKADRTDVRARKGQGVHLIWLPIFALGALGFTAWAQSDSMAQRQWPEPQPVDWNVEGGFQPAAPVTAAQLPFRLFQGNQASADPFDRAGAESQRMLAEAINPLPQNPNPLAKPKQPSQEASSSYPWPNPIDTAAIYGMRTNEDAADHSPPGNPLPGDFQRMTDTARQTVNGVVNSTVTRATDAANGVVSQSADRVSKLVNQAATSVQEPRTKITKPDMADGKLRLPRVTVPEIKQAIQQRLPERTAQLPKLNNVLPNAIQSQLPAVGKGIVDAAKSVTPNAISQKLHVPDLSGGNLQLPEVTIPKPKLPDLTKMVAGAIGSANGSNGQINLPDVNLPNSNASPAFQFEIPQYDLPEMSIPQFDFSTNPELPATPTPDQPTAPEIPHVAQAALPQFETPRIHIPQMPQLETSLPQVQVPTVERSVLDLSNVNLPNLGLPDFQLPDPNASDLSAQPAVQSPQTGPSIPTIPQYAVPNVTAPSVNVPQMATLPTATPQSSFPQIPTVQNPGPPSVRIPSVQIPPPQFPDNGFQLPDLTSTSSPIASQPNMSSLPQNTAAESSVAIQPVAPPFNIPEFAAPELIPDASPQSIPATQTEPSPSPVVQATEPVVTSPQDDVPTPVTSPLVVSSEMTPPVIAPPSNGPDRTSAWGDPDTAVTVPDDFVVPTESPTAPTFQSPTYQAPTFQTMAPQPPSVNSSNPVTNAIASGLPSNVDPNAATLSNLTPDRTTVNRAAPGPGDLVESSRLLAKVGNLSILAGDAMGQINEMLKPYEGQVPEEEIEQQRQILVKQVLPSLIDNKLIFLEFLKTIPADKLPELEKRVFDLFAETELPKLMEKADVKTPRELDAKLRTIGSSIEKQRRLYMEKQVAQQIVRSKVGVGTDVTHDEMLQYYEAHLDEYRVQARARFEHLMARFDKFNSPGEAKNAIAVMGNAVLGGAPSTEVAKRSSQGPMASVGGVHDWTTQGSLASDEMDRFLFRLPVGKWSQIFEDTDGYHIMRVVEREPAGEVPFASVQDKISEAIQRKRFETGVREYLAKLRSTTPVWTVFDEEDDSARVASPAVGNGERIR